VSEPHLFPSQPSEWGAWIGIRGLDVLIESWEARANGFPIYRSGTRKVALEWARNTERLNPGLPRLQIEMASLPLNSEITEPDEVDEESGEVITDDRPVIEAPVAASDETETEPVLERVRKILAELASKVPYGEIATYQLSIFFREVLGSRTSRPKNGKLQVWGTSEFSDPNEALKELRSGLNEILKRGTTAAQLRNYKLGKGPVPSWIEIPRLGSKWVCGPCSPAPKEETKEYLQLTGKKATPKPRGRPKTRPPKKKKGAKSKTKK
jgi:hypothetical protein